MKAICKICYHYELCKEDERCLPEYLNCNFFKNKLDVVEVVRCKDCKYQEDCARQIVHTTRDYILELNVSTYNNVDYCSYGKRKCDND